MERGASNARPIAPRPLLCLPSWTYAPFGHADAMQIILFCMAPFQAFKLFRCLLNFWRARRDSNS